MKLAGLEGLRGIMCLWVVVSHTVTIAALPIYKHSGVGKILANGSYAVDVFILLSGFVIAFLINQKKEPYGKYIARRALRLFPAYLVCIFLSALILGISIDFLNNLAWEHPKTLNRLEIFAATQKHLSVHTFLHIFMLQGLPTNDMLYLSPYTIMGQAWSITLEWQFYIIAPLLVLALNKKWAVLGIAFVISLIFLQPSIREFYEHKSFIFANITLFISGIVSYLCFQRHKAKEDSQNIYIIKIVLLAIITMVYQIYHFGTLYSLPSIIWTLSLLAETIICQNLLFKFIKNMNNSKPVLLLGKISYSVYCFHMISLYFFGWLFTLILPISNHIIYAFLVIIFSLTFTLVSSYFLYLFVEKFFINLGKKIS